MPALGEYVNVYDSALLVLENKGFQVWFDRRQELYCAEKDGWDFVAESPISLLGLVGLFEARRPSHYQEYWWREAGNLHYKTLPTHPRPYVSVVNALKPDPRKEGG